MLKKVSIVKGVSIVLVISMFGMAAPSLPLAYAAGDGNSSQQTVQEEQQASLNVLSKLEIQGITFDQTFSPDIYQYTATVKNDIQSVTLLVKSENENAMISVNGQTVENGTTQPIPLQTGDNQISIKVDDGVNTPNTYTLTVRKQSSNNLLQDLQLSTGELSPKFDTATTAYTVQVANDVSEITVTPVAAENTASIIVNDTLVTAKGISVQLPVGKTEITILVTAENGDKKIYTVEVAKTGSPSSGTDSGSSKSAPSSIGFNHSAQSSTTANKNTGSFGSRNGSSSQMQRSQQGGAAIQQPSKATLSALTVTSGTWNKTFAKDTYTYHIAVGTDIDTVAVNGTPTYSGATISVEGSTNNTIILGDQQKTIVPVVVTKDSDRKTYILVFDKNVPQAVATTADNQAANSSDNLITDTSIQNSNVTPTTNNWNGRTNNGSTGSTSLWSRLIESIRSFFSKL